MAFNDAMTDLTTGRIDYAVVGGASGIFRPQTSIAFQRLHMMSPDVRPQSPTTTLLLLHHPSPSAHSAAVLRAWLIRQIPTCL